MIVFLNGRYIAERKARISIRDHGFLYGDGVYETIRVAKGQAFHLDAHIKRLAHSMIAIRLRPSLSLQKIKDACEETIRRNRAREAVLRIHVTRGEGAYGFAPNPSQTSTILVTVSPFKPYPAALYRKGATVAIVPTRRNDPRAIPPSAKTTNCLNGILARREAAALGAAEGVMLDTAGNVAEGTVSNVFFVKRGALVTPPLGGQILSGVTRLLVIDLARQCGINVLERNVRLTDLRAFDEMFLTSTLMNILPVQRVIGIKKEDFGLPGKVTLALMQKFREGPLQKDRVR
jgi:branched-chain amino acid aminotransferase